MMTDIPNVPTTNDEEYQKKMNEMLSSSSSPDGSVLLVQKRESDPSKISNIADGDAAKSSGEAGESAGALNQQPNSGRQTKRANYGGIGVSLFLDLDSRLYISKVSPSVSGFLPDDEVLKIEGVQVSGLSMLQLRNLVMGNIGTSIRLVVNRNDKGNLKELEVVATRLGPEAFQA